MSSEAKRTKRTTIDEDLFIAVVRAASHSLTSIGSFLKTYGLSEPQYNALRILRGAREKGMRIQQIRERMLTRVPDVSRLVDRLEKAGYVSRCPGAQDRRSVEVRVTGEGLALLETIEAPLKKEHASITSALTNEEKETICRLLEKIG